MRNPQMITKKNQEILPLSHIPIIDSAGTILRRDETIDYFISSNPTSTPKLQFEMESSPDAGSIKKVLGELPYPVSYNKTITVKRFDKWIIMINFFILIILVSFTILHNK